jgi:23S rRNA (adenine2030-N6)-methyltransferase
MNYRHSFHAGNFADVLKHVVLGLCLERLNAKPSAWRYIDTHAGIGAYDLGSDEAQRSPEWRDGVERVWRKRADMSAEVQAALSPWLTVLKQLNPLSELSLYPGSPKIAQTLARDLDRVRLCELHPADVIALRAQLGRDRRVKVEERDGYEALSAYLPPPERRGLVLLDPPFEEGPAHARRDFGAMLQAMDRAMKRWPGGMYVIWRPLKQMESATAFDSDLATLLIEGHGLAPEKLLVADLWVKELGREGGLPGAGVLVVNPPFGLEGHLRAALPWLAAVLEAEPGEAGWRLSTAEQVGSQ